MITSPATTRHLFGLLGRFRTADGYDADDGQCKYQYDQFKVIIP